VLQCVAVCCSALQCVAVCNSILIQFIVIQYIHTDTYIPVCIYIVLQCVAGRCSVLQCVAVCYSILIQFIAIHAFQYGVATISSLLKIVGLFCKI